jgi:predicted PurR-regulated permease PerM
MARGRYSPEWQRALILLTATTVAVAVIAMLYWARSILIPVALAVFLAFVLAPLVTWTQRRGLGRTPAVALVVGLAVLVVFGIGVVVTQQVSSLTESLPDRRDAILAKVAAAREWLTGSGQSRLGQLAEEVSETISSNRRRPPAPTAVAAVVGAPAAATRPEADGRGLPARADSGPVPVVIESSSPSWISRVEGFLGPATEALGQAAFAFVLTVFMLLKREDLRNRMIRLIGFGRVTTTTKAVDDASQRISRYLLTQLVLNSSFGVVVGLGLYLLGVKYALLWAVIAFLMRYVPYIGTWIGLIPPTLFSLAMSEGWGQPVAVLALFIGLELICNNVFEPMLYGPSMGISEVALLVAAGFWAFLWGPVGLILSGPLTVCLLVLGKYVHRFEFLAVLLGDEPALDPQVAFYQRLTARDQDEAAAIALREAEQSAPEAVYDAVIVPALCLAKRDHAEGELSDEDLGFALRAAREVAEEVAGVRAEEPKGGEASRIPILLCPARDEVDGVAVELLAHLLDPARWDVHVAAVDTLVSELLATIADRNPAAVVVGAVPPGGLAHSRYVVARIKARFPDVKVVVGRWGRGEEFPDDQAKPGVPGADWVDATLAETRKRLTEWHPVFTSAGEGGPAAGKGGGKKHRVGTTGATP